jgi:HK97 gp10 family phage protein|nr:MAG TPA: putative tail component [Caudoviricetes sp.]
MKLEIKITSDAEKILKKFNNTATVEKDVSKLVKDTLYNIERDAKKKCPVDTGRLRGSITTNIISTYSGEVGTNVEYAEYVEYGTRYQSAQPYFEPAVDENEDKFNDALDEIIERLLE